MIRSPPDQQTRLPPLFSQTQQTSAVVSPPPVQPEPIKQAIDITELQKDEMHRAAEQARLRRQQEEAEREAQKERARQKAKEIAEREAQRQQASAAARPAQQTQTAPVVSDLPKEEALKSTLKQNDPRNDVPRPAARPAPSQIMRRTSEKRVAFEETVSVAPTQRMEPRQQHGSLAIPGPTSPIVSTSSGDRRGTENVKTNVTSPQSSATAISPSSHPFSAFFDPLAESSHLAPTELHYNDMSSLSTETARVEPIEPAKAVLPGVTDRYNLLPELLQAESWRKSTRGQEVVVPGVIGSSREPRIPQKVLLSKPIISATQDTLQTTEELVLSPPAEVKVKLPPPGEFVASVGSAFDTVLARLQNAMSVPSDSYRSRTEANDDRHLRDDTPVEEAMEVALESETRITFSALPRPQDFVASTMPLPPSPAPAWKRYTIRLPRVSAAVKPYPRRRTRLSVYTPPGWALSWDPPLEQAGARNMPRDDWLIPKTYQKGKLVVDVKLPPGKFQPYVPPPEDRRPGEASSITSQAIKEEGHKSGSRKIVVKLPSGNFRPRNDPVDDSAITEAIREEFQTSSDIPSLSPSSSAEDLPLSRAMNAAMTNPTLTRKTSGRAPQGAAIAFARPHGESFSDEAEAKSSVRFMVSSQIEDDNLLSEVNKMSMDGLTDNPAAEETQRPGREAEPRVRDRANIGPWSQA